jgi:hypothetical protein
VAAVSELELAWLCQGYVGQGLASRRRFDGECRRGTDRTTGADTVRTPS